MVQPITGRRGPTICRTPEMKRFDAFLLGILVTLVCLILFLLALPGASMMP